MLFPLHRAHCVCTLLARKHNRAFVRRKDQNGAHNMFDSHASVPATAARRPMRLCMCPSSAPHLRQVVGILSRQSFETQRIGWKRDAALHSCIID